MVALVGRRLLLLLPVIFGVSLLTFVLSHVVPGDPARMLAGTHAGEAQVQSVRHSYGLDRPLPAQYWAYISNLAHGNFGTALHTQRGVGEDLRSFLPATLELGLTAMVLAVVIGIPLGTLAAVGRNRLPDHLTRVLALCGVSLPIFWVALVGQLLLYYNLGLFPSGGRLDPTLAPPRGITGFYTIDSLVTGRLDLFVNSLWHLILPALVLSLGPLAIVMRITRSGVLEALAKQYVRTARAKGVRRGNVVVRHALRNALLPTVTVVGLQFGYLLGGAVLVEYIFSWPGVGLYTAQSITASDYPAIMGVTIVVALLYVVLNLLVDIGYALLDPRIRYR
ncbi:MAG: dipeptide transport system permease protein dppB [Chloroflexi bacterium]|nr:dipeptide transport system permease protein dppB [Chloroflexota bacterium]MDB5074881.1 dipeptide transport system permease protein dppB [Chloroflexota bacterium]